MSEIKIFKYEKIGIWDFSCVEISSSYFKGKELLSIRYNDKTFNIKILLDDLLKKFNITIDQKYVKEDDYLEVIKSFLLFL